MLFGSLLPRVSDANLSLLHETARSEEETSSQSNTSQTWSVLSASSDNRSRNKVFNNGALKSLLTSQAAWIAWISVRCGETETEYELRGTKEFDGILPLAYFLVDSSGKLGLTCTFHVLPSEAVSSERRETSTIPYLVLPAPEGFWVVKPTDPSYVGLLNLAHFDFAILDREKIFRLEEDLDFKVIAQAHHSITNELILLTSSGKLLVCGQSGPQAVCILFCPPFLKNRSWFVVKRQN